MLTKVKDFINPYSLLFKLFCVLFIPLSFLLSFGSFFMNVDLIISFFSILLTGSMLWKLSTYVGCCDGPNAPVKYNFSYLYLFIQAVLAVLFIIFIHII